MASGDGLHKKTRAQKSPVTPNADFVAPDLPSRPPGGGRAENGLNRGFRRLKGLNYRDSRASLRPGGEGKLDAEIW